MQVKKASNKIVKTRMAPSPTGEYHIGHIRTLLYNWAFARKNKGKFIIRIEDTDRERYVKGAEVRILDIIKAYGFDWDEGPRVGGPYVPYIQSQRLDIYKKFASELLAKGAAYCCFCTEKRLQKMREEQRAAGIPSTKYDRLCLRLVKNEVEKNLKEDKPYVIRMKVPENRLITFEDMVVGKISVNSDEIDDQVLIKSDGFPTYHFAVVVDDHLMEITHVMRGNDWIPSTPKHILLYQAFGWDIPVYIHLPNLKEIGAGKKLSKRYGAVAAAEFLKDGYLPEALLNFLMFLGWNPGTEKEIYSLEEFIKDFSIEKIHKTDMVAFDREKLDWMSGYYIKNLPDKELAGRLKHFAPKDASKERIQQIAPLIKDRIKKLSELMTLAGFFFERPKVDKKLLGDNYKLHLGAALEVLKNIEEWNLKNLESFLLELVDRKKFHRGNFFMDVRIAVAGSRVTPPINESMVILGKEETISRLRQRLKI